MLQFSEKLLNNLMQIGLTVSLAALVPLILRRLMKKRYPAMAVIVSGLVGSAVDSAIFLSLAFGSVQYLFGQVLGKFWINLLAGVAIAVWRRRKQSVIAIQA